MITCCILFCFSHDKTLRHSKPKTKLLWNNWNIRTRSCHCAVNFVFFCRWTCLRGLDKKHSRNCSKKFLRTIFSDCPLTRSDKLRKFQSFLILRQKFSSSRAKFWMSFFLVQMSIEIWFDQKKAKLFFWRKLFCKVYVTKYVHSLWWLGVLLLMHAWPASARARHEGR